MTRRLLYLLLGIGILFLLACPAQAFTAKTLDISVQDNGDAIITFDYSLSWYENVAVFTHIADPTTELKSAIENNFNAQVDVLGAGTNEARVLVHGFASRSAQGNSVTLTTPALSFQDAERVLKQYWFAPLISVDFSPDVTTVDFPDGFVQTYYNQISIPGVSHTMG